MADQGFADTSSREPENKVLSSDTTTKTNVLVDFKSTLGISFVALLSVVIYIVVAWNSVSADIPNWLFGLLIVRAFIEGAAIGALALVTGTIALSIVVNRNTTVLNNIAQIVKSPPLVISQELNTDLKAIFVKEVNALKEEKLNIEAETRYLKLTRDTLYKDVDDLTKIKTAHEERLARFETDGEQIDKQWSAIKNRSKSKK